MSAEPAAPCRTRPSNANKHPGEIVLRAKVHRRTAEEIAVAKAAEAEKATAAQVGIQRLARMELAMEEKQVNSATKKARPVRPPPKGKSKANKAGSEKEKSLSVVANDEAQGGLTENAALEQGLNDGPSKRKKKKGIRESINRARHEINSTSHHDGGGDSKGPTRADKGKSTLFFLNLTSNRTGRNPNFTLSGKIQNWISGVDKPSKPHTPATQTSNSVPPSTVFTHLTETSQVTIESTTSAGTGGKSGGALVGGFDDEEPEDDSLERQVAQSMDKKGREAVTTIALTLDDSDNSLYDDGPTRAPFTQSSEARPVPHPRPVPKRKADEILEVSSDSEFEDVSEAAGSDNDLLSDIDGDDFSMDVDPRQSDLKLTTSQPVVKQGPADTGVLMRMLSKPEKACRTTNSTSVKTVDTNTPAAKRVKTEPITAPISATPAQAQPEVQFDTPAKSVKPRAQYRTTDLPAPVQADQRWAKKFCPTVILWMGSLEDDLVWTITDVKLLEHVQIIFDAVYPELSLKVAQNGTVQRLSEWRSTFGSTAIALVIDFLLTNQDCDPQVLSRLLLKDYAFLFADMDLRDPLGVYHSAFMLQLFGKAHLASIGGHANIPTLKTHTLATSGMVGAFSLCAAALERAVEMIAVGDIKAEDILAATSSTKISVKLPKVLNKATGKETSIPFLFSRDRCAKKTKNYARSIKKKGAAFVTSLTEIARSAWKENVWPADSTVTDDESDDERALLCIYALTIFLCIFTEFYLLLAEFDGTTSTRCYSCW
ncbi:hypothetical protein BDR05DRAFT_1003682 [Suillus weaverae]|nr:hypothetical protein BDR05DRAFT_1006576 [Suillus weaverae]KAG2338927.1 hypothetical protein BDR05DRAFT_1003755 [Suillus weaverae]KAG2338999.1 hypothetical protein BDR05DRAFT_1003682 [Suillus weaverae]